MPCDDIIIIVDDTSPNINLTVDDVIQNVIINIEDAGPNVIINVDDTSPEVIINVDETIEEITIVIDDVVERIIETNVDINYYIAGEILGSQRLVMIQDSKAFYYDISNENNVGKFIGITNQAATINDTLIVVGMGNLTSAGWGLTPNAIYYAGSNGQMTLTAPTIGILQRIGVAIDADTFKIEISEPLIII